MNNFTFSRSNSPDYVAQMKATSAKYKAESAKREAEYLKHDINKLYMITEALWQMLKENCKINDDEISKRIMEIDMKDGRLDNKTISAKPKKCPKCERTISKKHTLCIYCGTAVEKDPFSR